MCAAVLDNNRYSILQLSPLCLREGYALGLPMLPQPLLLHICSDIQEGWLRKNFLRRESYAECSADFLPSPCFRTGPCKLPLRKLDMKL